MKASKFCIRSISKPSHKSLLNKRFSSVSNERLSSINFNSHYQQKQKSGTNGQYKNNSWFVGATATSLLATSAMFVSGQSEQENLSEVFQVGKPKRLKGPAKSEALEKIPEWRESTERNAIERNYVFKDFEHAFIFMTILALYAEQHSHHPEWFNVYNRVNVTLTTHDCSGVSEKDISMAQHMDRVYSLVQSKNVDLVINEDLLPK